MESTTDLVTQSIADLTADETKKKKTIRERISYVKEVITVEPLIASYVLSAILVKPALLVLEYDKACRANLGLNETVCDNIVNSDDTIYLNETEQIQLLISDVHSWQLPIQSVMPLILVLFLGSYSDRHQWRKPFLLLPLIGELFAVAGCIISVLLMDTWSLEVQGVVQTVVPSFFGGQTMLTMAVFAYIADVSTLEMRTLRVGIVQIVINACVPTVQSFSAVLFTSIGYIGVLIIAGFLYLSGIIYGFFCIKEPKRPIKESKKNFLLDIFDTRHAIDTFKLILKKSPGNDRLFIVLLLLGMFVYTLVNVGEDSVFFLYTRGFLNWSIVQYTSFLTANTLIHLVGTIIAVPLFTKFLKLHDLVILLLSFLDKIVCNIFFGIAQDSVLMYVGAAVSLITGVTSISLRSLATKVVSENDLGKAQSLFGIVEAIGPAVAAPVYNVGIYSHTYETLPSAFFYFSAIVYAVYVLIIIWMYIRDKAKNKQSKATNGTTTSNGVQNNGAVFEKPIQMEDIQVTHMAILTVCPNWKSIMYPDSEKNDQETFKDTIKRLKEVVTVEPLIAFYQMALFISKPALDNLEFEKACRVNLNFNSSVCDCILNGNHSHYSSENEEIQKIIISMHSWQQPLQSFSPLILVLFLGSFSDRHKWRKPFFLVPIVGELSGLVGCILCVIFMKQLPLEAQGISQKVIPSFFGGQTMLAMATTAYIADISTIEMRTLRLGIVQIVISVVLPFVQSFSGIFFVKVGYLSVLGTSTSLYLLALLYGFLWIKETRKDRTKTSERCILADMFDPKHAKETFNLLVKKSAENDRFLIWILVLMVFLYRAAFDGESNVLYLYTQSVFQWTPLEYSYFLTVNSLVALAGHLFGVPLFTRVLHLSDSVILLIAIIDKIVTNLFFGLATGPRVFYAGVAVSIVTRVYRTAKKSIATKIVSKNDVGKAQSLLGICDVLAPALFVPIYNKIIYMETFHSFPAAFFFCSILLYGISCIFIIIMYVRLNRKTNSEVLTPDSPDKTNIGSGTTHL
uniref:Major facilitator superfamily (MFS) profile domain-containing protein n=1 Tax=Dendroctonus ponderosae TaxID=77166 RepID=A0AAR5NWG1_DENPD